MTTKARFQKIDIFLLPICLLFTMLVYARLHEASHAITGRLFGWQISEMRLVPHFWSGEFINAAYVRFAYQTHTPAAEVSTSVAPYAIDLLVSLSGLCVPSNLFRRSRWHLWLFGLFFVWAPTWNTVSTYIGTFFTSTDMTTVSFHFGFHAMAFTFGALSMFMLVRFCVFVIVCSQSLKVSNQLHDNV